MRPKILPVIIFASLLLVTGCKKNDLPKPDSHTKKYPAQVISTWYKLLTKISRDNPYPPPPSIRIFAYTGVAIYESVVPGMPSYKSIFKHFTGNEIPHDHAKEYFWPAAANAAASRIASKIMENYGNSPGLLLVQQLEDSLQQVYAGYVTPEMLQISIAFGRTAADKVYEWSEQDGTLTAGGMLAPCPAYVPLGTPGKWEPTPPGLFPAAGACQGNLRTFIPGVVQNTRPPSPPAYSTEPGSDFYIMSENIYNLSQTRTYNDSLISEAWRDRLGMNLNTPAHILRLTTHIIEKENLNLEQSAVIFAKQGLAMFDAIAASFGAKFHYALLRPVTYIRTVLGKPTWNSIYPTPQHPSYAAVAPAAAAAGILPLEKILGNNYSFKDSTQHHLYGTWNYPSFNQLVKDVGISRTHSGLNFEISVSKGIIQGRAIGEMINNLPFKK